MSRHITLSVITLFLVGVGVGARAAVPVSEDDKRDENVVYDETLYKEMKYRSIGPTRGGRSTTVTGVANAPFTFYMGASGGGVWKTENAGQSWENISDDTFAVGSIGAIAVAPSDPNVVYVGTGSACPRGNVSVGKGIYKSTDAGRSFEHIGLTEAGQIGRIRIHPSDADLVYVAATGHIFGPNEERGVFRSRDGGESWDKVLFVSEQTGAVDLSMNPKNPRQVYAAMWRVERKPWTLVDGGEESGLYLSVDGGDEWKKLEGGLPDGEVGRIGVSVSPANPDRVYALVTAKDDAGGIYRTENGGEKWTRVTGNRELRARGWYYSHVEADPKDENTLYVMNTRFYKSIDGGKSFERIRTPHGDNHDLWINPDDPKIMVEANDGGGSVTLDGGKNWSTLNNQPTAEFYRVIVDEAFPYRLYGAQQDNSTISVPSWRDGGLTPFEHWRSVAGGESGHIAVTPGNSELTYAGNYIGQIDRFDRSTGERQNVIIYPQLADGVAPKDLAYRFQWNAPILISPHDPAIVYHTSNFVHRTMDGGINWETISPDLTSNDVEKQEFPGGPVQHDHSGVEVYGTVFAFEESPHSPGMLWAGTDDGRIHRSMDAGKSWADITPDGMPVDGTVNLIDVSAHQPGRAFSSVFRYRMDDFRPYVFRTDDYGESWTLLTSGDNGIPRDHPVRVVREDPDRMGLLYAGTEFGVFVSFDDGAHWQSLQLNLPHVPVTDLRVHEKDLVIATQGRSFWILDDLTPLHQLSDELSNQKVALFAPRAAYRVSRRGLDRQDQPWNPGAGALIRYYLDEAPEEGINVSLEVLDRAGETVRRFLRKPADDDDDEKPEPDPDDTEERVLEPKAGLNRFVWDLLYQKPHLLKDSHMSISYTGGFWAKPGRYRVRLTVGETVQSEELEVLKDPRLTEVSEADLEEAFRLTLAVRDKLNETHDAIRTLRDVRVQLDDVVKRSKKAGIEAELETSAKAIKDQLTEIEEDLIQVKNETGQDPLNFPPKLDNQLAYLFGHVNSAYGRPTAGSYQRFEDLKKEADPYLERFRRIVDEQLPQFNAAVVDAGGAPVMVPKGPFE